jgi:hypothetical protein
VILKVSVCGQGAHRFAVRSDNLTVEDGTKQLTLKAGAAQTFTWRARIVAKDTPWVAVIVPDGDLSQRQELMGSVSPAGKP